MRTIKTWEHLSNYLDCQKLICQRRVRLSNPHIKVTQTFKLVILLRSSAKYSLSKEQVHFATNQTPMNESPSNIGEVAGSDRF